MSGAKGIKNTKQKIRGSATVEAAIVLPVFLIVLFSLAYIIRIFYTYNTMQDSLSEVARRIGNMSYFYYVSGLKDYSDRLDDIAQDAEDTLDDQKNTIINTFGSFNDIILDSSNSGAYSINDIESIISDAKNLNENMTGTKELIETIVSEPEAELRLFMTIFFQKLSYEVNNRLVCFIAKGDLASEIKKRVSSTVDDAAQSLGIINGMNGLDFNQSSIFGDSESLEFVVNYRIKAPVPFGIIPELKLTNRVKIIAWTGGRGESVKLTEKAIEDEQGSSDSSIWTEMDKDNRYWDRGLEIEELHVGKLVKSKNNEIQAFATSKDYAVIDAYTYNKANGTVEYYDVFTLNPFLKTYSTRPSAISSEIKKHGKRLLEFEEIPDKIKNVEIKSLKRVVILIIPENSESYADVAFNKAKTELKKLGVDIELVKDYGDYSPPENQELKEAS